MWESTLGIGTPLKTFAVSKVYSAEVSTELKRGTCGNRDADLLNAYLEQIGTGCLHGM